LPLATKKSVRLLVCLLLVIVGIGGWCAYLQTKSRTRKSLVERARACILRNEFDQAINFLNQVGHDGETGFEAVLLSGECLVRSGQLQEAVAVLSYAVERRPDCADGYRWLAACYYDLGAATQAVACLLRVTDLDQSDARPYRLLGKIYRDFKRIDDAIEALESASRITRIDQNTQAEILLELAQGYVEKGLFDEARGALVKCDWISPKSSAWHTLQAECSYADHEVETATRQVRQALRIGPNHQAALQLLARISLENDEPNEAVEIASRAVQLRPDDHKSRHVLSRAYRQLGMETDAEREEERAQRTRQLFDRLTELSKSAMDAPTDARVRLELAKVWIELGRDDMAATWLRASLACDPNLSEARDLLRP